MESAIPEHLRSSPEGTERTAGQRMPPYPSFVARFRPTSQKVVMAYFGVQSAKADAPEMSEALAWIAAAFSHEGGPSHWDRAVYIDEAGYHTTLSVAYWDDDAAFATWFPAVRNNWTGENSSYREIGRFIEVLHPSASRYETLFSSLGRPEGVANLAPGMSGEIYEHAYWGGMRDRIPQSQTDALDPVGTPHLARAGNRIRVEPHENLCLIRSGQDWMDTEQEERTMYLRDVEPVLREGMTFLRDEGGSIGCYANRYMRVVDAAGLVTDKSYGMSWWHSLADLERWAESHPTHLKIFGAAMKYLSKLGPAAKLRLYHEVTVVAKGEQFFEYMDCHQKTGMLGRLNHQIAAE